MINLHSKEHRGHLYLYTFFCKDFYAPNAFKVAYNVTARCPNCGQMKQKKKNKCQGANLTVGNLSSWAIDLKGPVQIGNQKKYLLCFVELNFRLVHFQIASSLEATEIARLLFETLCSKGNPRMTGLYGNPSGRQSGSGYLLLVRDLPTSVLSSHGSKLQKSLEFWANLV